MSAESRRAYFMAHPKARRAALLATVALVGVPTEIARALKALAIVVVLGPVSVLIEQFCESRDRIRRVLVECW